MWATNNLETWLKFKPSVFNVPCMILFSTDYQQLRSRRLQDIQEEKAMASVPLAPIDVEKAFIPFVQERRKKKILFKGELLVSTLDKKKTVFCYYFLDAE
uniref:Uncharacterized protein n=1 Tax=Romanomermis culicivorax TaxID=13658 RepID=A0A915JQF7_ROMCU